MTRDQILLAAFQGAMSNPFYRGDTEMIVKDSIEATNILMNLLDRDKSKTTVPIIEKIKIR